ncbi:MAG TPA: hypothetical protein VN025_05955 [Candidatus Dormibacteraeota bacterium]|jgi:hypothetical protein|nr:hypothetical protein [Candidatus Dormibacteraeota bacterium]
MANTQAKFFNMPNPFELEQWLEHADRLAEHAKDMAKTADWLNTWGERFQWDIGDWLLDGEAGRLPVKKLKEYAAQKFPRRSWHTLENWKVTARAIESSRRRDGRSEGVAWLPFSTHQIVAKYDPELQDQFLQEAFDRKLSGQALKRVIRESLGRSPKEKKWVPVTIKVPADSHELLNRLAQAKGFRKRARGSDDPFRPPADVATTIWWMAGQYYKEHKAELDALLKPAKS